MKHRNSQAGGPCGGVSKFTLCETVPQAFLSSARKSGRIIPNLFTLIVKRPRQMRIECTDLLLKYRDMMRMIWNSAFWTNADLHGGDCFIVGDYISAFDEAVARLYEGMVLLPLGHNCRVEDLHYPGKAVPLSIEVTAPGVDCLIDQDLPGGALPSLGPF